MVAAQHLLNLPFYLLRLLVFAVEIPARDVFTFLTDVTGLFSVVESLQAKEVDILTHTFLLLAMHFVTILLVYLEALNILVGLDDLDCQFAKCYLVIAYVDLSLVLMLWFEYLEVAGVFVLHGKLLKVGSRNWFFGLLLEFILDLAYYVGNAGLSLLRLFLLWLSLLHFYFLFFLLGQYLELRGEFLDAFEEEIPSSLNFYPKAIDWIECLYAILHILCKIDQAIFGISK